MDGGADDAGTLDAGGGSLLYVDAEWRVVCGSGGNCTSNQPSRVVLGRVGTVNSGDPDSELVDAQCSAVAGSGTVSVDVEIVHSDYAILLSDVVIPAAGGANTSAACSVSITDTINISGDLVLLGSCSPAAMDAAPCSVQGQLVQSGGRDAVRIELSCDAIETMFDPGTFRNIERGGSVSPSLPSSLLFRDCSGL